MRACLPGALSETHREHGPVGLATASLRPTSRTALPANRPAWVAHLRDPGIVTKQAKSAMMPALIGLKPIFSNQF